MVSSSCGLQTVPEIVSITRFFIRVSRSAAASAAAGGIAPAMEKKTAAPERTRMPASPTVPSGSVELRRDMQLPPREWLSHIRELEQQGRHQQAIESLRLFIRAHPDRKVPADLQLLLD